MGNIAARLQVEDGLSVFRRLLHHIQVDEETGCWIWKGETNGAGYGRILCNGSTQFAHRVSYAIIEGPIPEGIVLHHKCKNRACVHPKHVEPLTEEEHREKHPELRWAPYWLLG